jgi:hypothetical protein
LNGLTPYSAETVTTQVNGSSLSVTVTEVHSTEPQLFFCGFNYEISGLTASLVGSPKCPNGAPTLMSASFSLSASGTQLTLDESGVENDGTHETFHGDCSLL